MSIEPIKIELDLEASEKIRAISKETELSARAIVNLIINKIQFFETTTAVVLEPGAEIRPRKGGPAKKLVRVSRWRTRI